MNHNGISTQVLYVASARELYCLTPSSCLRLSCSLSLPSTQRLGGKIGYVIAVAHSLPFHTCQVARNVVPEPAQLPWRFPTPKTTHQAWYSEAPNHSFSWPTPGITGYCSMLFQWNRRLLVLTGSASLLNHYSTPSFTKAGTNAKRKSVLSWSLRDREIASWQRRWTLPCNVAFIDSYPSFP